MERNPYFFGVDADGNQLPYIDNINHRLFETNDVFDLWIINGEIDFQAAMCRSTASRSTKRMKKMVTTRSLLALARDMWPFSSTEYQG